MMRYQVSCLHKQVQIQPCFTLIFGLYNRRLEHKGLLKELYDAFIQFYVVLIRRIYKFTEISIPWNDIVLSLCVMKQVPFCHQWFGISVRPMKLEQNEEQCCVVTKINSLQHIFSRISKSQLPFCVWGKRLCLDEALEGLVRRKKGKEVGETK
jgi:hypothetical protein